VIVAYTANPFLTHLFNLTFISFAAFLYNYSNSNALTLLAELLYGIELAAYSVETALDSCE